MGLMSAERLREAAALMVKRANDVPHRPWWVYERAAYWGIWASLSRMGRGYKVGAASTCQSAEYLASWHPTVALAVADWLHSVAVEMDRDQKCDAAPGTCNNCQYDERSLHALAVANAYLGEKS